MWNYMDNVEPPPENQAINGIENELLQGIRQNM